MKKLLRALLVLFVLVLLLGGAALFFADRLAVRGIEAGGTQALGVPTHLESADVGLLAGRFQLDGLRVENPDGYQGEHLLTLQEGSVAISLGSLLSDEIVAPHLELTGIGLLLERGPGGMNYDVILRNLESGASKGPKKEEAPSGKHFVLEEIVLRDITASIDLLGRGEVSTASVTIPEIVLNNLGREPLNMRALCNLVLTSLLQATLDVGDQLLPKDLLAQLQGSLEGSARAFTDDIVGQVESKLGELSEALGPQGGQLLEGALDKAKGELDEGLKGLFGEKKKP